MKKKGFTLIELLAVIVILAIIALIATPIILNVIEKARKGSVESSMLGYVDAIEKQAMMSQVDSTATKIEAGTYNVTQLSNLKVEVKGDKPDTESVFVVNSKGQVSEGWATFYEGEYKVYYDGKKAVADKEDYKDSKGTTHNDIGTPVNNVVAPTKLTFVAPQTGATHKGIVYLDPTDLTKVCTEEDADANVNEFGTPTEIKTGCMKWYIFNDTGDNYTMILDHNTTARIKWNDSNSNVAYESSNLKSVVDNLVTTSGWEVTPRLITADEVNTITGKTGFNVSSTASYYYLDTLTQTKATFSESVRSSYDWLYNNLNKCKTGSPDQGCTIEDGNTYSGYGTAGEGQTWGYWTSTPVGTAGSGSNVWLVARTGRLNHNDANGTNYGVRPVISVSKSQIS